jgi:hypothetical protein
MGYVIKQDSMQNIEIYLKTQTANKHVQIESSGTAKVILNPGSGGVEVSSGYNMNLVSGNYQIGGNNLTASNVEAAPSSHVTDTSVHGATNLNTANRIVMRDASGNFVAGTITANLSGNASGSSGSCAGNAVTATTATKVANALSFGSGLSSTPSGNFDGSTARSVSVTMDDTLHGNRGGGNLHSAVVAGGASGFMSGADKTKLNGIETGADVTDATNVAAATAVMDADFPSNGILKRTGAGAYGIVSDNSSTWNIHCAGTGSPHTAAGVGAAPSSHNHPSSGEITGSPGMAAYFNGSNFLRPHPTAGESDLSYLHGVTSSVQTQLNGKVNLTDNQTIGGTKTFSSTISGNISGSAGSVASSLSAGNGLSGGPYNGASAVSLSVSYYASNPAMNGMPSAGSNNNLSRGDHVHPSDTSRATSTHTHSAINGTYYVATSSGGSPTQKIVVTNGVIYSLT